MATETQGHDCGGDHCRCCGACMGTADHCRRCGCEEFEEHHQTCHCQTDGSEVVPCVGDTQSRWDGTHGPATEQEGLEWFGWMAPEQQRDEGGYWE